MIPNSQRVKLGKTNALLAIKLQVLVLPLFANKTDARHSLNFAKYMSWSGENFQRIVVVHNCSESVN